MPVGISRYHFHRVFKAITGVTPKAYADARRADRVRAELPKRATVTDAIYEAGFNSNGRFYERSAQTLGMHAARLSRRRQRRIDPLRGGAVFARVDPRRRHRHAVSAPSRSATIPMRWCAICRIVSRVQR